MVADAKEVIDRDAPRLAYLVSKIEAGAGLSDAEKVEAANLQANLKEAYYRYAMCNDLAGAPPLWFVAREGPQHWSVTSLQKTALADVGRTNLNYGGAEDATLDVIDAALTLVDVITLGTSSVVTVPGRKILREGVEYVALAAGKAITKDNLIRSVRGGSAWIDDTGRLHFGDSSIPSVQLANEEAVDLLTHMPPGFGASRVIPITKAGAEPGDELVEFAGNNGFTYVVGRHKYQPTPRPRTPSGGASESHHEVMDRWIAQNFQGSARGLRDNAPTILLPNNPDHNATRRVYTDWVREMRTEQGSTIVDWTRVTSMQILDLAARQMSATGAPLAAQAEYRRQFTRYVNSLETR